VGEPTLPVNLPVGLLAFLKSSLEEVFSGFGENLHLGAIGYKPTPAANLGSRLIAGKILRGYNMGAR
jgi:hypothetical protein